MSDLVGSHEDPFSLIVAHFCCYKYLALESLCIVKYLIIHISASFWGVKAVNEMV